MKKIPPVLIRIVFAFILGLVLVAWPDVASNYVTITIGILFIIPGILSILSYFFRHEEIKQNFPVAAVGSAILGLCMVLMPEAFVNVLMYVLGAILILGACKQIYSVYSVQKTISVSFGYYVFPALILLGGILVIANPEAVRDSIFIIIGVICIVYSIVEAINWFRLAAR